MSSLPLGKCRDSLFLQAGVQHEELPGGGQPQSIPGLAYAGGGSVGLDNIRLDLITFMFVFCLEFAGGGHFGFIYDSVSDKRWKKGYFFMFQVKGKIIFETTFQSKFSFWGRNWQKIMKKLICWRVFFTI